MTFDKTIYFLMTQEEMFYHYTPVWKYLKDFCLILHASQEEIIKMKNRCAHNHFPYIESNMLLSQNKKVSYLVSHQFCGFYKKKYLLEELATFNIRFMYGLGKEKWQLSSWNNLYDLFLVYGPYQKKIFEQKFSKKAIMVGYPRYDNYFSNEINKEFLEKKLNIDQSKKTIVWLPTWGQASSINDFASIFSDLTKYYNVIVKSHPGVQEREKEKWSYLLQYSYTHLIKESFDNINLFTIADFIFSDYGGVPFGAIYTNKNIFLLDIDINDNDNFSNTSPDLLLRNDLPHIGVQHSHLIHDLLNKKELWDAQNSVREKLRKTYFAPFYGYSAIVMAAILENIDVFQPKSSWKNSFTDILKWVLTKKIVL